MKSTRLSRRALLTRSAQGALAAALGDSVLDAPSSAWAASSPAAGETIPFFTVENDPDSITWLNNAIASFRAHGHPGVKINENFLSSENQLERLQVALATHTDLGIFTPPMANVEAYARAGYLRPLDDIVRAIGPGDFE